MKKTFWAFAIALFIAGAILTGCNKKVQISPELQRVLFVQKHLREHFPDSEFAKININTDSVQSSFVAFVYDFIDNVAKERIDIVPNPNRFYYYNLKGDRVQGFAFNIVDTKSIREGKGIAKVVILSKAGEVVYCGTDYPSSIFGKEHIGECTNEISNNSKAGFVIDNKYNDEVDTVVTDGVAW